MIVAAAILFTMLVDKAARLIMWTFLAFLLWLVVYGVYLDFNPRPATDPFAGMQEVSECQATGRGCQKPSPGPLPACLQTDWWCQVLVPVRRPS